jgi:uncharacterized protein YdaT
MLHKGNYPSSYQHQPVRLRQKAAEIANSLIANGVDENSAAEAGLRKAREFFLNRASKSSRINPDLPAFP